MFRIFCNCFVLPELAETIKKESSFSSFLRFFLFASKEEGALRSNIKLGSIGNSSRMSRAARSVKHPNRGGASRAQGTKTQTQRWGKPKTGRNSLKHYFSAGAEQVHMDEEKSINADGHTG
jgi:hypothetical protein